MVIDRTKYLEDRIDRLFMLADASRDDETKAELACFAAVLTSGLLEARCRQLLLRYTAIRSKPQIARFVESRLHSFQNAKVTKIHKLFGGFDPAFSDRILCDLSEAEVAAIDSVVSNKNNLAHGANSGLSLEVMREYYRHVRKAIDKIASICA